MSRSVKAVLLDKLVPSSSSDLCLLIWRRLPDRPPPLPHRSATRPLAASPPRSSVPPFVQFVCPPDDFCTHSFQLSRADFNDLAPCAVDINTIALGFCRVSMLERTLNVCNGARRATLRGLWLAPAVINVWCNVGFVPRELIYQGKAASVKAVSSGETQSEWISEAVM